MAQHPAPPPGDTVVSHWITMVESPTDTTHRERLAELIDDLDINEYQLQELVRSAAFLPCLETQEDPGVRLVAVLTDHAVAQLAHSLSVMLTAKFLTHDKALKYAPSAFYILDNTDGDHHPHDLYKATLAGADRVSSIISGLSFTPTVSDVANNVEFSATGRSLFPNTSKNRRVTRKDIENKVAKTFAPTHTRSANDYDSGKKASDTVSSSVLDVDDDASELLMQGNSFDVVMSFHHSVPQGYWEAVTKAQNSSGMDIRDVYDMLEDKFGFHPDNRKLPGGE